MNYQRLTRFIDRDMRMSQVYQPVFLKLMLESNDGTLTEKDAAREFRAVLNADRTMRYDVARYPGEVLVRRGVIERVGGRTYRLIGFADLREHERLSLIGLCDTRIERYLMGSRLDSVPVSQPSVESRSTVAWKGDAEKELIGGERRGLRLYLLALVVIMVLAMYLMVWL